MKIEDEFVLTEVDNRIVAVPVGETKSGFKGIIRMNDTAAFIFKCLKDGMNEQQIAEKIIKEYSDVDYETAISSIHEVLNKIKDEGIIE